jgi:CysZ protein
MALTTDLSRALQILWQPASIRIMLGCTLITAALYITLALAIYGAIVSSDMLSSGWLETLAGLGGGAFVIVLGWFLFPGTCTAISGLFVEGLASRIEAEHYPGLPPARRIGFREQLQQVTAALRRTSGLNLLCAPLYLIPGLNFVVYSIVNSKLLAREYFYGVALCHLSLAECEDLYKSQKGPLFQRGLLISTLFVLPGINLFAPVLATALMTHFLLGSSGPLRARLAFAPSNVLPNQPNGTEHGTG